MLARALGAALAVSAVCLVAAPALAQKADWDPRDAGPDTLDASGYPADQQARYQMFAAKCVKCHPLSRPINSHFNATEWKRYMKRMIRRPNSGINEEQAAQIYEFLKFYSVRQAAKG
jgi:hypothetical protein